MASSRDAEMASLMPNRKALRTCGLFWIRVALMGLFIFAAGFLAASWTMSGSAGTAQSTRTKVPSKDRAWCPKASCTDSPLCLPCQKRYLIVLATARSASTTMLDTLNHLPGVRLAGENNNAVEKIHELLDQVLPKIHPEQRMSDAWAHEPIRLTDMACTVQSILQAINPPRASVQRSAVALEQDETHTIVGFKTIRFQRDWEVDEAIAFVRQHFPCSRFIVNYSENIQKQAESWVAISAYTNVSQVAGIIAAEIDKLKLIAAGLDDQAFVMETSIYDRDPDAALHRVNEMIEWLGFEECTFPRLMHANMNHTGKVDSGDDIYLGDDCHYAGDWPSVAG